MTSLPVILAAIDNLRPEELAGILARVAARLVVIRGDTSGDAAHSENGNVAAGRLLTAQEAAERASMSADWFYRNAKHLPFTVKLGGSLRFLESGLEAW